MNEIIPPASKLVDAKGLLVELFDERSRPTVRWVRQMQAQRVLPFIKIGRLVFFDVDECRHALAQRWTVRSKTQ
ncbi:hypothetical protein [Coraliomargarita parva]|uniref:hypothetical protein n=1 Tax=Coraliomargarita parva TaxID=3014050 RepID=UPI0022B38930|nr:hypothetical protein [Coraliomargarita parva]